MCFREGWYRTANFLRTLRLLVSLNSPLHWSLPIDVLNKGLFLLQEELTTGSSVATGGMWVLSPSLPPYEGRDDHEPLILFLAPLECTFRGLTRCDLLAKGSNQTSEPRWCPGPCMQTAEWPITDSILLSPGYTLPIHTKVSVTSGWPPLPDLWLPTGGLSAAQGTQEKMRSQANAHLPPKYPTGP